MVGIEKLSKTITKKHAGPCEPSPNYIEGFRISQMGAPTPKEVLPTYYFGHSPRKLQNLIEKNWPERVGGGGGVSLAPLSPVRQCESNNIHRI